jgi:hypothetical protein
MMWRRARTEALTLPFHYILATSLGAVCSYNEAKNAIRSGGGAPSSRETRQIRGSLVSERTVAMASDDARISEQLVEHDGVPLRAGIPSHSK